MERDEALDQREPDPEAALGSIDRRVHLREHGEHVGQRFRSEADAIVRHRHLDFLGEQANRQRDAAARIRILGRIGEQIRKRLRDPQRIDIEDDTVGRNVNREAWRFESMSGRAVSTAALTSDSRVVGWAFKARWPRVIRDTSSRSSSSSAMRCTAAK